MQPVVRFGHFELRSTQRTLWAQGHAVPLGSRALDVLLALVARPGELLTKDDLLQAAWPGLVVEEANVHVAVSQLRKVLGKAAIATVGGLGYRFAWPLLAEAPGPPLPPGLPQPRTAFVGRQAELAAVADLLQSTRLLTVVAMGGMGKTRLALQLAQTLQGRYADGVFFVDLQPLAAGGAVPAAVARALALPATTAAADTTAALLQHLQRRQVLLVLDNCEHLLPAVQQLVQALVSLAGPAVPLGAPAAGAGAGAVAGAGAGAATVLATSRCALVVPGERVFALRPLQLPPVDAGAGAGATGPTQAAAAPACEAVQLFVQRVRADNPGFAPGVVEGVAAGAATGVADGEGEGEGDGDGGANGPLVADICRRLDGIPLALELAAARMKMLSLQQLHALLAQRFDLLSSSGPAGSPRQQTLQGVLQWSHDHLAAPEQALAQAVAVCTGGFDLDTAVALVGGAGVHTGTGAAAGSACGATCGSTCGATCGAAVAARDGFANAVAVLDGLAQLADRALIHVTHGAATARYGMLETVREYLLAQLTRSGRLHGVRQRHLQHFHALALQAEAATAALAAPTRQSQGQGPINGPINGPGSTHGHGQNHSAQPRPPADIGTTEASRWAARLDAERDNLLAALAWCHLHGSPQCGLEMVAALKNFWFASGWLEQGQQAAEAALARVPAAPPTLLTARVQRLAAQLCLFLSRLQAGALHARQALAQSQALGDEAGAAAALCFAGRIAVKSEDTTSGEQLLLEGLRRARQVQALSVVGEALNALAFAAIERNDLDAAEAHFSQALLASQQRGSALGSVIETLNLAWVSVMNTAKKARPAAELEPARQLLLSVWRSLQQMPHRYVAQELIDVCASYALHRGAHEEAALLQAASAAQRLALQLPLTANQAARRASEAAAVRAALGDHAFDRATAQGHALPHGQTLARVGAWLRGEAAAAGAVVAGAGAGAGAGPQVRRTVRRKTTPPA